MRHPLIAFGVFGLLLSSLLGTSCKKEAREAPVMAAQAPALEQSRADGQSASAPASPGEQAPQLVDAGRKLVKTVDLEMQVDDTTATADRLRDIVGSTGGYVSAMSAERRGDLLYYSITLRVPVDRLEATVKTVKSLAKRIEREAIRTDDVTERWVDIEARLTTLRATENELLALLREARQRNQKVEDIMAVYGKLTEIRTSIEQLEAEQKALQSLTSLSTINLQLVPTEAARPIVEEGWNPGGTLRQSFRSLVGGLQSLADVAIVLLVVVLPIGALIVLPIWLLFRLWKRARARARGRASEEP
jgi:uncharacterized protein DUF4349